MTVHSPVIGRYRDVCIDLLKSSVQQFAVKNKNCLLTETLMVCVCQFQVRVLNVM